MKTCVKCGLNFDSRHCPECAKVYCRKYDSKNREKKTAASKAWFVANPGKKKEYAARWYAANIEKHAEHHKKWRKDHPDARRIQRQTRRARKKSVGGTLSKNLVQTLLTLQKGKCACCGAELGDNFHLDHIMPLALGGANEDWNMQLLTSRCNIQKSALHPVDFMQSRGFLI